MRKSAILLGLIGCAVLATAAWSADKKNDGPGMTASQKIGSLFGLIDVAKPTPPPSPPGMPAMGEPGTVRMPSRNSTGSSSALQHSTSPSGGMNQGGTKMPKSLPDYLTADPSMPQPPQPQRATLPGGVTATATDAPGVPSASALLAARPQTSPSTMQPRPSIVGASKQPLFSNPSKSTAASPSAATNSTGGGQSSTSSRRAPTGKPATAAAPTVVPTPLAVDPIPTPIPLSKPIPVNKPDAPSTAAAPSSSGSEPFVPSVPQFTGEPSSVASSNRPATLPSNSNSGSSTAPIPVNRPDSAAVSPSTASADSRPDLLSTLVSPDLTIETVGPRKIAVGREARYRIQIRNRGRTEARDVVVLLEVPQHAEIVELHGTAGNSTSAEEFAAGKPLAWQLDVVPANSQEEMTLTLIPHKSEAFELGVRWTTSTPTARTTVEVQEPKLALTVTGPSEVSFGEQRLYKLVVSNPGNGTAENVVLQLQPLSPGDGGPLTHAVGNLRPGESNAIEVELTARQAGTLKIRAAAAAEGGLKAEAAADVIVRRANLDVVVAAPRMLFAGVPGTYEVRVRNTGDDTARNVKLNVDLPSAAKLLTTTPSIATGGSASPLAWTFDRIAPGSEHVCIVKCAWDAAGRQQLTVIAAADGDLRKSAVAATDVQAVADLALDVIDTPGPVPVGQPVTYEIRVKNRGLKSAEGVDVVAYFSDGIEPEKADGHTAEIQTGMVVYRTLPSVGPGQERILKVTARAQKAGNHRLRVEMQSAAPQTQLSHEDATFFYADEPQAGEALNSASPPTFQPQAAAPIRPAGSMLPAGAPTNIGSPIGPTVPAVPTLRTNTLR